LLTDFDNSAGNVSSAVADLCVQPQAAGGGGESMRGFHHSIHGFGLLSKANF